MSLCVHWRCSFRRELHYIPSPQLSSAERHVTSSSNRTSVYKSISQRKMGELLGRSDPSPFDVNKVENIIRKSSAEHLGKLLCMTKHDPNQPLKGMPKSSRSNLFLKLTTEIKHPTTFPPHHGDPTEAKNFSACKWNSHFPKKRGSKINYDFINFTLSRCVVDTQSNFWYGFSSRTTSVWEIRVGILMIFI